MPCPLQKMKACNVPVTGPLIKFPATINFALMMISDIIITNLYFWTTGLLPVVLSSACVLLALSIIISTCHL